MTVLDVQGLCTHFFTRAGVGVHSIFWLSRTLTYSSLSSLALLRLSHKRIAKMRGVMEHNTTLTHLAVDRLGIRTSMNHRRSVERWIQDSSLSAQGRRDHASIHFLCTFNSMGRENFVQAVHDGSGLPSANDLKSNQLIENIGSNKLHLQNERNTKTPLVTVEKLHFLPP